MEPDTGIPVLLEDLGSEDWTSLRASVERAADALRLGDLPASILSPLEERLIELAHHANWQVRKSVVHALHYLRDEPSRAALVDLCGDDNSYVRDAAIRALGARRKRTKADSLRERHEDPLIDWLSQQEGLRGTRERDAALRVGRRYTELLVRQAQAEMSKIAVPLDRSIAHLRRELDRPRVDSKACAQIAEQAQDRVRVLLRVIESIPTMSTGAMPTLRGDELRPLLDRSVDVDEDPWRTQAEVARPRAPREPLLLKISARPVGRRYAVALGSKEADLPLADFMVFLKIVTARLRPGGPWVHRSDLGARTEHGWKGVLRLNRAVATLLPTQLLLVEKDDAGHYRLNKAIEVGDLDLEAIAVINAEAAALAKEIGHLLAYRPGS